MASRTSSEAATPPVSAPSSTPAAELVPEIPHILPHERVFPIQIGTELFKLSGASISSDAPSYFSQYFRCQLAQTERNGNDSCGSVRTLYIDRDPATFRDISLHLQGYHVSPRDGQHFVRLFADAQFYNLPKLMSQLHEDSIFISIGHREFKIPRKIFSDPGNTPNYFSLGYGLFFSSPQDAFPGLDNGGLLRPPSILPPSVPGRSAEVFAELLHLLRGYPVHVRDATHRAALLRDARYFNFKGVEQRLIAHTITHNQAWGRDEIVLRVEDIVRGGIGLLDEPAVAVGGGGGAAPGRCYYVSYRRPHADDRPRDLVFETAGEAAELDPGRRRARFVGEAAARVARLLDVALSRLDPAASTSSSSSSARRRSQPPEPQPGGERAPAAAPASSPAAVAAAPAMRDELAVALSDRDASVVVDGEPWRSPEDEGEGEAGEPAARKRRRTDEGAARGAAGGSWIVRTGQWRIRIQLPEGGDGAGWEAVLVPVKLDVITRGRARNAARAFLEG